MCASMLTTIEIVLGNSRESIENIEKSREGIVTTSKITTGPSTLLSAFTAERPLNR